MIKYMFPLLTASLLALTACDQNDLSARAPESTHFNQDQSSQQSLTNSARSPSSQSAPPTEQSAMLLAYRYFFSFSIPSKSLQQVTDNALTSCKQAGIQKCRIVSTSMNNHNRDFLSANIELRVDPQWFESYQQELTAQSKRAGGNLVGSNVTSEDLTIAISDSGARLNALVSLRTRLLTLLEASGATVKDLVEVERELARVQGQIEAATARLRILKTRVSMSEVHLSYETKSVIASRSSLGSIKRAVNNFVDTLADSLAGVIYFIAYTLPWLLIGLPFLWMVRKLWRNRKVKKQIAKTETP